MAMNVYVIDGMGGGVGVQLVQRILKAKPLECQVFALATNAVAAQRMVDAGAMRGASGENAFKVCLPEADFILGPLGIVLPNSMMGELSPAMAVAVAESPARKILLPLSQSHITLAGLADRNLGDLVEEAVLSLAGALSAGRDRRREG